MTRRFLLLLLAVALPLAAQPRFGDPLPLTNTRYRNVNASAKLVSNGRDVFLTWTHGSSSRMNPVVAGSSRVGRTILSPGSASDVIWTGRRFLAVSDRSTRILDSNGEPLTRENAREFKGEYPRLATNGRNVVMLSRSSDVEMQVMTLEGLLMDRPRETIDAADYAEYSIASNGDNYAAATASTNGVRVTLLDRDGRMSVQQWISGAVLRRGSPSVGTDRQRYLVAWNHNGGSIRAVFVDASTAAYGAPFVLAEPSEGGGLQVSSIVWTGTRYVVAYVERRTNGSIVHSSVAFVDRDGVIETRVALPGTAEQGYLPTLAVADGRVYASWDTEQGTVVRDVARPSDAPVPAAWSSNLQFHPRVVSSGDATLVAWFEDGPRQKWWMGIRGTDGSWIERELLSDVSTILLASDGRDFLIINHYFWSNEPAAAMRVSRDGSVQQIATLPFTPMDVAWNGFHYVVSGQDRTTGDLVAALLGASGSLSAPVTVSQAYFTSFYTRPVLASAGDGQTLVVWSEVVAVFPSFGPPSLKARLFDRELRPASAATTIVEQSVAYEDVLAVAFDGGTYVAVYPHAASNGTISLRARRIWRDGMAAPGYIGIHEATPYNLTATRSEEGIAIAWNAETDPVDRVAVIRLDGSTYLLSATPHEPLFNRDSIALTRLPDRRLGYFYVRTAGEEPYYGSSRIAMAIAAADVVPEAPVASVRRESESSLRVTWAAPQQSLSGYRLEYKAGASGEWTELERWFAPEQNETTLFLSGTRPASYSFRVRAWGDAGTSPYSNEATILLSKRRAVR